VLRYLVYRLLWALPTVFGVSVLAFAVTTLLPEPATSRDADRKVVEERRRMQFRDLPLFFNGSPTDVRTRALDAVETIAAANARSDAAAESLANMGGAALPHVIEAMGGLDRRQTERVAIALAPLAERLHVGDPADLRDAEAAPRFWRRFWEDRALDFTEPSVRRDLDRFLAGGSSRWERELLALDTYPLPEIMRTLDNKKLTATERHNLLFLAHAVTAHLGVPRDEESTERDEERLRAWWFIHRTEFVAYDGAERVGAFVGDTRYARWLVGALTGRLGLSTRDGESLATKLSHRAPITLALAGTALLLGLLIAVPVGAASAFLRGKAFDTISAIVAVAVYATPSFALSVIFAPYFDPRTVSGLLVPLLVLALATAATLSRNQRAVMIDVLGEDYVRAARARGAPPTRWLVVHALRNALIPVIALSGIEFAGLLGSTLVVEECFAIRGVGWETMRALEAHDVGWLVIAVMFTGSAATVGLIVSDVLHAMLDPQRRERTAAEA